MARGCQWRHEDGTESDGLRSAAGLASGEQHCRATRPRCCHRHVLPSPPQSSGRVARNASPSAAAVAAAPQLSRRHSAVWTRLLDAAPAACTRRRGATFSVGPRRSTSLRYDGRASARAWPVWNASVRMQQRGKWRPTMMELIRRCGCEDAFLFFNFSRLPSSTVTPLVINQSNQ